MLLKSTKNSCKYLTNQYSGGIIIAIELSNFFKLIFFRRELSVGDGSFLLIYG